MEKTILLRKFTLHMVFFLVCHASFSQDIFSIIEANHKTNNTEIAYDLYDAGLYFEAIPYFEKLLKEKNNKHNYTILYSLAECYRLCRFYAKAEEIYRYISRRAQGRYPLSLFWLARMQQSQEKYCEAIEHFSDFISNPYNSTSEKLEEARRELLACKLALKKTNATYSIQIAGPEINKLYSASGAVVNNDSLWFVATDMVDKKRTIYLKTINGRYEKVYVSRLFVAAAKDSLSWYQRKKVEVDLSDDLLHCISPAFAPDGKTLYFSICNSDSADRCYIYKSVIHKGQASKPEKLAAPVNIDGASSKHPFLLRVNNSVLLFFSSDRSGGMGGWDIYYVVLHSDGAFESLTNAGPHVNSRGNEIAPFYDSQAAALYFSSDGYSGYGNYDIYVSKGWISSFSASENLHAPFNSGADDYFYFSDGKNIFLSSNRSHPSYKNEQNCCDKIYVLKKEKNRKPLMIVTGEITDKTNKEPLQAHIFFRDTRNILIDSTHSTAKGKFGLSVCLPDSFIMEISVPGYMFHFEKIYREKIQKGNTLKIHFTMQSLFPGAKAILHNIEFESGDAQIKEVSLEVLDAIVRFMHQHPHVKIEVSGHTDNTGSLEYNEYLSEARAKNVVEYLISRGIEAERLRFKGYAWTRPIADNKTETERALNRRVEFLVIE